MKQEEILHLADLVAETSRKQKISITTACYVIFDQKGISDSRRCDLCSAICRELGHRGGKKSGKVRRQKKVTRKNLKNILAEAYAILAAEKFAQTIREAYGVTMARRDHLLSDP